MDPIQYLTVLRRRWAVLIALVIVGLTAGAFTAPGSGDDRTYRATHRLLTVQPANAPRTNAGRADVELAATAELVKSDEVLALLAERTGYNGDPLNLARRLDVKVDSGAGVIEITAEDSDPSAAAVLANGAARAFMDHRAATLQTEYEAQVASITKRRDELQEELRKVQARLAAAPAAQQALIEAERDALVRQYSLAYERYQQLASEPPPAAGLKSVQLATAKEVAAFEVPRGRPARGLLGGAVGLLMGAALALVLERFDTKIRTRADAERAFGVPVLADVPVIPMSMRHRTEVLTAARPNSLVAEAYRTLRTSLLLMQEAAVGQHSPAGAGHQEPRELGVILVTSPNPGEGKTTSVANMAASLAESGRSVLVIDCDFRHPRVQKLLHVTPRPGLSDVLVGGSHAPRLADTAVDTDIPGVRMVTSGRYADNPAELFAQRGHHFIAEARGLADVVIVDTPPLLAVNDAAELVPYVDSVVLLCRAGRTTVSAATRVAEQLRRLGAPLRGVVVAGASEPGQSKGYYYYYYRSQQHGRYSWRNLFRRGQTELAPGRGTDNRPPARSAPGSGARSSNTNQTSSKKKRGKKNKGGSPGPRPTAQATNRPAPPRPMSAQPPQPAPPAANLDPAPQPRREVAPPAPPAQPTAPPADQVQAPAPAQPVAPTAPPLAPTPTAGAPTPAPAVHQEGWPERVSYTDPIFDDLDDEFDDVSGPATEPGGTRAS